MGCWAADKYDKILTIRAVGAAVARPPHTRKATGSIPVLPTIFQIIKDFQAMSINISLALNFFLAVIAIMNPIGNVPIFLEHVNDDSAEVQKTVAKLFAASMLGILILFYFIGQPFLNIFGITIPAFRIAGGVLIMTVGFRMLHGKPKFDPNGIEKKPAVANPYNEARKKLSGIIVPVAIPIFIGPGTITTIILYSQAAHGVLTHILMLLALCAVCLAIGTVLYLSRWFFKIFGVNGMQIVSRCMGLILCAIAVQFIIDGTAQLFPGAVDPLYTHVGKVLGS